VLRRIFVSSHQNKNCCSAAGLQKLSKRLQLLTRVHTNLAIFKFGATENCSDFAKWGHFYAPVSASSICVSRNCPQNNAKMGELTANLTKVPADSFPAIERNDYCSEFHAADTMLSAS
jgi:hypothetical protein